ncbi:MAG: hypothetical protein ABI811_13665 [Acidobacteriota bacterium]
MKHPLVTDLALHASGDLSGWQRFVTTLHCNRCEQCRGKIQGFLLDRERMLAGREELPEGLDWDRLSAEMTANIRVGLAAGECVSPLSSHESQKASLFTGWNWRPAAAIAGLMVVFAGAWSLNLPSSDSAAIGRVFQNITRGSRPTAIGEDRGPVVQASSEGIEFRENGSTLGVSSSGSQPVAVSVSFSGSASARYVDNDTGQMTITTVYVQ